jgi:predicted alpha/beta superfamily hydrolase
VSEEIGQVFSIDVWQPIGMAGPHPVVYVLDGNTSFAMASQIVIPMMWAGQIPPVVVVGIGYEVDSPMEVAVLRSRDFLPDTEKGFEERMEALGWVVPEGVEPGGANAFLTFIENEVKPLVEARYPVDASNETLVGYSYGGTFATHVLLSSTDSFDRYVIGSPVLTRAEGQLFADEAAYAARSSDMPVELFLSAAEYEIENGILEATSRLMKVLAGRSYKGLALKTHVFPEETHESAISPTISRGLRAVFGTWPREPR